MPKSLKSKLLCLATCLALVSVSSTAAAYSIDRSASSYIETGEIDAGHATTQGGGMSLSEAVDSVRRRGNVERVISADTRISGGREVHHIKVLTKDGKVRTHKVNGRKR